MPRRPMLEVQAQVFRALGHETRLKIVAILGEENSKCVCELVDRLGLDQSTVSKHLALMRSAGIVSSCKRGLRVIYTLSMPCVYGFLKCIDRAEQIPENGKPCALCADLVAPCPLSIGKTCSPIGEGVERV